MSIVGIDVGSSSVKAAAYSEEGKLLEVTSHPISPQHSEPGLWEQDPEEIWTATTNCMHALTQSEALHNDPPIAIAVSASGRENFLADKNGKPLSPGVMGADVRGTEFEAPPEGAAVPEDWCLSCGHLRERMDPVFRLAWWRKNHPEIVGEASYFLGWHDFLTHRIAGRIVVDRSIASRYLTYDLMTHQWDSSRVDEYEIPEKFLPEIQAWPSIIGPVRREIADDWGLPRDTVLALGGHDVNCAAVGAGATQKGVACLISGSYENLLVITDETPTKQMLLKGLSVMPHPGDAGYSALAVCPTGNAVLNWARDLLGVSIEEVENELSERSKSPSSVLAIPYLSGSMVYWEDGRNARGTLMGLTLAAGRDDIVQAFMESIAYDHVNTFSLLSDQGIEINKIRAVGGGARSHWWTQLKADLTESPIEVVEQQEAGTLGAAILAGLAVGVFDDLDKISRELSGTSRIHDPNPSRREMHNNRIDLYRETVPILISTVYQVWN